MPVPHKRSVFMVRNIEILIVSISLIEAIIFLLKNPIKSSFFAAFRCKRHG